MAAKPGRSSESRQGSIQGRRGIVRPMQQRTRTPPVLAGVVFVLAIAGLIAILVLPGGGSKKSAGRSPAAPRPAAAGGTVNVSLTDFKITPNVSSVSSGRVTFVARNAGKAEHEM